MLNYFRKTVNGIIPTPRIADTRKRGSATQYQLVWDGENNLSEWVAEKHMIDLDSAEVPISKEKRHCNTRKDRDKRKNRHTCGIFIGY